MSDATPTTTDAAAEPAAAATTEPQELGDNGLKALHAERDARKAAEKTASEYAAKLKEFEDAKLSDLQKAQNAANESAAELAKLRTENTRSKVALAKGLPADLVEFLSGDTEEEVAAKADLLISRLGTPGTPKPDPSQGAKGSQAHALNSDPLLADLKNKLGIN